MEYLSACAVTRLGIDSERLLVCTNGTDTDVYMTEKKDGLE